MRRNCTCVKNYFILIIVLLLLLGNANAQYNKNPLLPIGNDGYIMVVGKFVKIPDDEGLRPRINSMTFLGNRLFTSTEGGKIYEVKNNGDGTYSAELFFDVKQAIPVSTGRQLSYNHNNFHSGLRSFAFHPDFKTNGKIYTSVMEERPTDVTGHHYLSDVPNHIEADGTLIEWTYDFTKQAIDDNSYREIFRIGIPAYDHPIKDLSFDRYAQQSDEDYGLLYLGMGDGHLYSSPGTGQNNDALGKILRINPLQTDTSAYSIPLTNPFVSDTNWLDEIYALGFRNPHTLCFARDDSGKIVFISANAGRDNIEELNIVKKGENYGWSQREGTYVQLPAGGLNTGIQALPDTDAVFGYTYPAAQWSRIDPVFAGYSALSIAGGYVYTISKTGEKIFLSSDFPQSGFIMYNNLSEMEAAKTKLDTANHVLEKPQDLTQAPFKMLNIYFDNDNDSTTAPVKETSMLDIIKSETSFDNSGRSDIRFGQDSAENIYLSSKRNGWIYKIESIKVPEGNSIAGNYGSTSKINVYPNPVNISDILHISINEHLDRPMKLSLLTIDGRSIVNEIVPSGVKKYSFNIGSYKLNTGYYILRLSSIDLEFSKGIIIK